MKYLREKCIHFYIWRMCQIAVEIPFSNKTQLALASAKSCESTKFFPRNYSETLEKLVLKVETFASTYQTLLCLYSPVMYLNKP